MDITVITKACFRMLVLLLTIVATADRAIASPRIEYHGDGTDLEQTTCALKV